MQRWMQQKEARARKRGTLRSGCNRALGGCIDDLRGKRGIYDDDDRGFKSISKSKPTEVHGCHVVTVTPKTREVNGTRVVLKAAAPSSHGIVATHW